jgi:phosphotransferase system  glucose/maltose/N-acetylglucosamine-specific IIC component
MKDKVMDALQRFSKAMFIPVLILPIAGILIAVGNLFTNVRLQAVLPFLNNPVTIGFGTLLSGSLNAILGNLGVIFCVGLSVGLANKKKSEAGFISLLAFLVFLNAMNKFMNMRGMLVEGSLSGTGQAMVLGVQVLDMGVFIGLLLGIVVAYVHNRFCETEFNNAFRDQLEDAGLVISGLSPDERLVEMVELPRDVHPWYVATQAHPEFKSRPTNPQPLFREFVRASIGRHEGVDRLQVTPMNLATD